MEIVHLQVAEIVLQLMVIEDQLEQLALLLEVQEAVLTTVQQEEQIELEQLAVLRLEAIELITLLVQQLEAATEQLKVLQEVIDLIILQEVQAEVHLQVEALQEVFLQVEALLAEVYLQVEALLVEVLQEETKKKLKSTCFFKINCYL